MLITNSGYAIIRHHLNVVPAPMALPMLKGKMIISSVETDNELN